MSPLLRMVFGVSGAGHSHDSSLELLPVLVCGLAHLPATDSCEHLRSFVWAPGRNNIPGCRQWEGML